MRNGDSTKFALVFPGQGSQWVGMGQDLYEIFPSARKVFTQADSVLGFPLSKLCFEGPEDELRQTINAQPAILTMSIACLEAAAEAGLDLQTLCPTYVAGHSLGEYTSLIAAGVLDFSDAVSLARERGRLMQNVRSQGGMAAIIALNLDTVEEICQLSGAQVANVNCPGQIAISGGKKALGKAKELARQRGGRFIPLEVSGPFHSSRMRRALRGLVKVLAALHFRHPTIPIVANTTACPVTNAWAVRAELRKQLYNCVQWQNSVEFMSKNGVSTFVEVGPGKVLSGLTQRVNREAKTIALGNVSSIKGQDWDSLLE